MPAEPRIPGTHVPYWMVIAFVPIASLVALLLYFVLYAAMGGVESGSGGPVETYILWSIAGIGVAFAAVVYADIRYVRQASRWTPQTLRWVMAALVSPFFIYFGPFPVAIYYLRKRRAALGVPEEAWVTVVQERIRDLEMPN
ncbi:hypothetical protein [Haloparvum sedimenti]|uniref:hypothetical protein n=1 Tax=Haloparvum sedimenti TaxID=1678448 RepID=UPI000F766BD7|nr:hypothetical protein [Haloparvum sedimenti]